MKIIVNSEDDLIRIDKYLTERLDLSRSKIDNLISLEQILVNGQKTKSSYIVSVSDEIIINLDYQEETDLIPKNIDLDIVYEDDYLLVINKQSGLVVHPGSGNKDNTLVNALLHHNKKLSDINGEFRPGIVHRLDKDTSGLMLVAKDNKTHNLLSKMISNKSVKREYTALIVGEFKHQTAEIDAPIGRDPSNRKKMAVVKDNSKEAVTHLNVIKRYKDYTLVKLLLETGRTHQIRVHLSYINFPIYNDPIYNKKKSTDFGQFLHSSSIEFIHPITKKTIKLTSNLPEEFNEFISNLEEI